MLYTSSGLNVGCPNMIELRVPVVRVELDVDADGGLAKAPAIQAAEKNAAHVEAERSEKAKQQVTEEAAKLSQASLPLVPGSLEEKTALPQPGTGIKTTSSIEDGALALVDFTLAAVPQPMQHRIADAILTNLSGAFAAAESALHAVGHVGETTSTSHSVVSAQLMNMISDLVWNDPAIPVNRKLEIIFKLMTEMLSDAQHTDAAVRQAQEDPAANLSEVSFAFPRIDETVTFESRIAA